MGSVFLERVPAYTFTGENLSATREMARVLEPGGELTIWTGTSVRASLGELEPALVDAGFENIRVEQDEHNTVWIFARKRP